MASLSAGRGALITSALPAQTSAAEALVEVRDDGFGVPEDMQDLIFEGFERGHDTPGLAGSLGLGLALSRKLAELMNGTLTHHRQGGETVFRLSLPRAESTDSSGSGDDLEQSGVVGSGVESSSRIDTSVGVKSAEQPAAVTPPQG